MFFAFSSVMSNNRLIDSYIRLYYNGFIKNLKKFIYLVCLENQFLFNNSGSITLMYRNFPTIEKLDYFYNGGHSGKLKTIN